MAPKKKIKKDLATPPDWPGRWKLSEIKKDKASPNSFGDILQRTDVVKAYRDGQLDLLDYLRGNLDEVSLEIELDVRMWCLGVNFRAIGALKSAELKGKSAASSWNYGFSDGGYGGRVRKWRP
jgi:hypothetical protein